MQRIISIVWCLQPGPLQVSWGMAETRRWEVLALERRVSVLTVDRRMAFLGALGEALAERVRVARRGRRMVERCILKELLGCLGGVISVSPRR